MVKPSVSFGLWGGTEFPVCHLPPFQDKESMRQVMQAVDKANGYSFGDQEHRSLEALMSAAVGADFHFTSYPSALILCCVEFYSLLPWGRGWRWGWPLLGPGCYQHLMLFGDSL